MGDFKIKTCGSVIRNARELKELSINELNIAINNKKVNDKLIQKWESSKAYPDLEMCYKLAEILELNPTELLHLRNYERKKFKVKFKKKNMLNSEVPDEFFWVMKGVLGLGLILIAIFVAIMYIKLEYAVIRGGKEELEKTVVTTVENYVDK